jgi:hypothetical protein
LLLDTKNIKESYRAINEKNDKFDIDFWQAQGEQAIFEAAFGMVKDYLVIRNGNADESGLQRSVEHYGKI